MTEIGYRQHGFGPAGYLNLRTWLDRYDASGKPIVQKEVPAPVKR